MGLVRSDRRVCWSLGAEKMGNILIFSNSRRVVGGTRVGGTPGDDDPEVHHNGAEGELDTTHSSWTRRRRDPPLCERCACASEEVESAYTRFD